MRGSGFSGRYLTRRERALLARGIVFLSRKLSSRQDEQPDTRILKRILGFLKTNDPKEKRRLAFFFKGRRARMARLGKGSGKDRKSSTKGKKPASALDKSKEKATKEALAGYTDDVSMMFKGVLGEEGLNDEEVLGWLRSINSNPELKEELWEILSAVGQERELFRVVGHELLQGRGSLRSQDQISGFLSIMEKEGDVGARDRELINFFCSGGQRQGLRLSKQISGYEEAKAQGQKAEATSLEQRQHELPNANFEADDYNYGEAA